jgi:hypothetical protein
MIAHAKPSHCTKSTPAWHEKFLAMMPIIRTHARIAFRRLGPEAREEAVQAVICNSCAAYARLVELGKADLGYPTVLARYGVAQVKDGRRLGGHLNCKDITSEYCRRVNGLVLERLDKYDSKEDSWQEAVVEDRHVGPAEVAATRIDFSAWLQFLPRRLRKIATFLANGETTSDAAKRFHLSQGRISQIRKELFLAWHRFVGDEPALAVA